MDALNECFEKLTGAASSRAGGQAYAGRTLVYEDCIRDVELELGEALVASVSTPMLLVLQSARWYCAEISQRFYAEFRRVYEELSAELGMAEVSLPQFMGPYLDVYETSGIVASVKAELQRRWQRVLSIDAEQVRVQIHSEQLQDAVQNAFEAPGPGWPTARHHSPDVLFSAKSIDALKTMDFTAVLGEVHVGHSTVAVPDNADEHFEPEALVAAREADLPVCIAPTNNTPMRVMNYSISDRDYEVETGLGLSHRPREKVLSMGACFVFERDGELFVGSKEGGPEFHLLAFVEEHLVNVSFSDFELFGKQESHSPRVLFDNLVVQREAWRMNAEDIPGRTENDRATAFLELRRWARTMGLPRFIFVKTENENKPFFVDLDSAVLVANLLRHLQEPGRVAISEMLPDFDGAWLEDRDGQRYGCEMRFCYVDPEEWSAP